MDDNMCEKCKFQSVPVYCMPCAKCKHSFPRGTNLYEFAENRFSPADKGDACDPTSVKGVDGYTIKVDDQAPVFAKILGLEPEREEAETEEVDHPTHYAGKIECIDAMLETMGRDDVRAFCLCNAFKYLWRCKQKHETPKEDVEKAIWYLEKYLELGGDL